MPRGGQLRPSDHLCRAEEPPQARSWSRPCFQTAKASVLWCRPTSRAGNHHLTARPIAITTPTRHRQPLLLDAAGRRLQADSICYVWRVATDLADVARRVDSTVAKARADLVRAVRQASASGMTQAQIAAAIGRSQPEVSRLLHFHGTSPAGRTLRQHRGQVTRLVKAAGGSNVRVFGSVATGFDHADSDIDLLFTVDVPMSLMQLGHLEQQISALLGLPVDLLPDSALRPAVRARVLAEAVPL